jgi:hypothetical protein
MRRRLYAAVLSWPFLCALALLLLNDWWLKSAWPGMISGKLSDFAGIALIGLLLLAQWHGHAWKTCTGIAAAFLWWKSPLSGPFIELVNAHAPVRLGRTVDYGDLAALAVLPLCSYVVRHGRKFQLPWPALRPFIVAPVVAATAFGVMATSVIPTRQDYEVRRTSSADQLQRERVNEVIASVAARHDLTCERCPRDDGSMVYVGRGMTMSYAFRSADAVWFKVEASASFVLFGTPGRKKADALQSDLKYALGEKFRGLELVEPLRPPSWQH